MDQLLYRILLGYIIYNPGIKLRIYSPSIQVLYESCVLYNRILSEADNLTEEEMLEELIKNGIWTEDDEHNYNVLPRRIEDFKVDIFLNFHSASLQEKPREQLSRALSIYNQLFVKRHAFDYVTNTGVANFAKWQYIIAKSTYRGKKRWNWSLGSTQDALNFYYSQHISDEQIRLLARTNPWDNIYNSESDVFGKPMINLTQDQHRLLSWSRMYEAAYGQSDYPPKKLIEDDDIFDGWLIYKSRDRNKLNPDKIITNPKIANAQEIFIPARNKEEAQAIYEMNSNRSRNIIRNRAERVKQEGTVDYHKFKDVQMRKYERNN